MKIMKKLNSLCTPAYVYLGVSLLGFISLLIQNCKETHKYKAGAWDVSTPCHNIIFFIFKAFYILMWTFILDKLCKKGYTKLSWFLFLMPLIFMFVLIGLFILVLTKKEGMSIKKQSGDPVVAAKMAVHGGGGVGAGEKGCKAPKKWIPSAGSCQNPLTGI